MILYKRINYTNQRFNFFQDTETVVESLVGYMVVFLVFLENVILIILLASRSDIRVRILFFFKINVYVLKAPV